MSPRRKNGLTVDKLGEWQKWLLKQEKGGVDRMKSRTLRSFGLRTLEYLQDLTPEGATGDLAKSMIMGEKDNVFEMKVGRSSFIVVGTNIEYAQAVEDGHKQRAGRFVPGEWRGDVFHYIPGHEEGMVLTGKVIPGAHMFDKAVHYIEDDIPDIIEFEFKRLYAELFK